MSVLVTGASGMVGANLCRALVAKGLSVRALTRRPLDHPILRNVPIEEVRGDLFNLELLIKAMQGCTMVYHVAGLVSYRDSDEGELYHVNGGGTEIVSHAAVVAGVRRLVYTSSTAAVGIPSGDNVLTEDAVFEPQFKRVPYMASKLEAESIALTTHGLEVVVVNPATIYGAGDVKLNTGTVFRHLKQGKLRFIPPGGTAVVSVRDCVAGHLLAMERGRPGRRYILASGNYTYAELFRAIAQCLGVPMPTKRLPRWLYPAAYGLSAMVDTLGPLWGSQGGLRHVTRIAFSNRYFSAARARDELGWQPEQNLEEMIREAVSFYAEHGLL